MAKQLKEMRLRTLDGVRDLQFGPAEPDARRVRDLSKDGKAAKVGYSDPKTFADDKAMEDRFQQLMKAAL